jgi:hypothetical protein
MSDPLNRGLPKGAAANWGAGFLPSVYQGTWLKPKGDPIDNLNRPAHMSDAQQTRQLALLKKLNGGHLETRPGDAELGGTYQKFRTRLPNADRLLRRLSTSNKSPSTSKNFMESAKSAATTSRANVSLPAAW